MGNIVPNPALQNVTTQLSSEGSSLPRSYLPAGWSNTLKDDYDAKGNFIGSNNDIIITIADDVYDLQVATAQLQTDVAGLTSSIEQNTANIAANTANISTNTTNISTNTTNISTNTTDISNTVLQTGTQDPEGNVAANRFGLYARTDAPNKSLWANTTPGATTGWIQLTARL